MTESSFWLRFYLAFRFPLAIALMVELVGAGLGHELKFLPVRNRIPGNFSRQEPVMSLAYDQLAAEAVRLSAKERADLADKLWMSVDTPEAVAAAWDAEIERRIAQIDSGEVETIPFEQVMAELRVKLR